MDTITKIIIDHSFDYAKNLLEDTQQCYPFGAFVDKKNIVHPLEFEVEDKKNMPNNETVINGLTGYCKSELEKGNIVAYGITYEADVQLDTDANFINTIAIDVIAKDTNNIPIYYFPYSINGEKTIKFEEPFAVKRG